MSLTLYYHPLSSFCMKALMALYENATPFTPHLVDLGGAAQRAKFIELWPAGKFPVLRDDARDRKVPESSIIIEYLLQHYPAPQGAHCAVSGARTGFGRTILAAMSAPQNLVRL